MSVCAQLRKQLVILERELREEKAYLSQLRNIRDTNPDSIEDITDFESDYKETKEMIENLRYEIEQINIALDDDENECILSEEDE